MKQIDYEPLLPKKPPVDLVRWLTGEAGGFKRQYLIYRAAWTDEKDQNGHKIQAAKVVCSSCGGTFFADKIAAGGCHNGWAPAPFGWEHPSMRDGVISGQSTVCPLCGAEAETVHVGKFRDEIENCEWVTVLERVEIEGGQSRLALVEWCVKRLIDKDGRSRFDTLPYSAWVVEERKIIRLVGYQKGMMGVVHMLGRFEQRKGFCDTYGDVTFLYPTDWSVLEGTTAENCKLDRFIAAGGKALVGYLSLWRKRPNVENLLVQGVGALVSEMIDAEKTYNGYTGTTSARLGIPKLPEIDWKQKRPAQMLGLNKDEFATMKAEQWDAKTLEKYKMIRDAGVKITSVETKKALKGCSGHTIQDILEGAYKADFWRIVRYLNKHKAARWDMLRDYWDMAGELGRDLTDDLVRWPRNLTDAHDRANREKKVKDISHLKRKFAQRKKELDKYAFEADGLLIRPCATERELVEEGDLLHHCVATYATKHANGATAIFFVRLADAPDTPYYTLELDEKKLFVKQNRGKYNCAKTPEVQAFENMWMAWIKAGCRRNKKGEPITHKKKGVAVA